VWSRSAHTTLVGAQLNTSMRLISGTLRLTQLPWLPVLANVPPPSIRQKVASDKLLLTVEMHHEWPVHQDFFNHPPARLPSRKPIWSDLTPVDISSRWRADCKSSSVLNSHLISDPTIRPAGFNLRHSTGSLLNQFCTGQGQCAANLHKWRMAASDKMSVW